ncbi:MAG TPA: nitrilase-related carbon-nitrogen hydrolase [Pyrinomonadaceae bacterium]|jgi:apolipoprotein N-acyltransferase
MTVSPAEQHTVETIPATPTLRRSAAAPSTSRRHYLLLLAALPLMPFANGAASVPVAAWLAPALLLCFVRARPAWRGLALGFVAFYAAWCFQWRGVVRLPWTPFLVAGAVLAFIGFLPYVAHRLLAPRLGGLKATLVFPSALVTMEYLFNVAGPNGSWGSLAYTQYGNLALMQLASLTGLWGLTFLIGWGAATAAYVSEPGRARAERVRAGLTFAAVLGTVLLYGGARLALPHAGGPALRVASVSPQYQNNENYEEALAASIQDYLYERSEREALAGAKMILWPEDSFAVWKRDEAATLERARDFARRHGVYFGVAYGARVEEGSRRYENKSVMFTPAGDVAWEYMKAHPVPGYEEMYMVRGRRPAPVYAAPEGRFAAAICYDGDFPGFMRRAAPADLLILHADDWRAITPFHARMSVFRAVELGVSLVRPTLNGLSLAADYRGEVLAAMNHFDSADRVMTASVPARGVVTLYSLVGDAFAGFAALCLLSLTILALLRPARPRLL